MLQSRPMSHRAGAGHRRRSRRRSGDRTSLVRLQRAEVVAIGLRAPQRLPASEAQVDSAAVDHSRSVRQSSDAPTSLQPSGGSRVLTLPS